jgi:hypothetical protein
VALGWFVGLASFIGVCAIPNDDLLMRVEVALVVGSVAALIVFAVVLRGLMRRGVQPDEDSILEAFSELPLGEP